MNKSQLQSKPLNSEDVKEGTFILVQLTSENSKVLKAYQYVAICQGIEDDNEIRVMFLKTVSGNQAKMFKLNEEDIAYVSFDQIKAILPEPTQVMKGNRIYYKFEKAVNIWEKFFIH